MREHRIESILKISPELIDPKLKGCRIETQLVRGQSRLDLLAYSKRGAFIIEIKKGTLSPSSVDQLLGYCRSWSRHHTITLRKDAYLVGLPPHDGDSLIKASAKSVFRIHPRYLGVHVPKFVQEKERGGYERWTPDSTKKAIRLF